MILTLDNSNNEVAFQIFTVFQNAYKVEAQLLGVVDFPPLLRSVKDIESSKTHFWGYVEHGALAAVLEISNVDMLLEINSLTVAQKYFRKGIANKLLSFVLDINDFSEAIVETAVANIAAINLYQKHGFVEIKRWTPSHGIEKLAMSIKNTF